MDLQLSIDLSEPDANALCSILGCDQATLSNRLSDCAGAALNEYVEMFLRRRMFSRGSDFREYRLLLMVEKVFGKEIPTEAVVCCLFQSTAAGSRIMIRSVMSKYQYELQSALRQAIQTILAEATQQPDHGSYEIVLNNSTIVELFNQKLAEIDGTQRPVQRQKDSVPTYEIVPASYGILCKAFGVVG